ncbi:MAG: cofactor-independent phosphoglycerate mutase [Tissierellia bacterium]|nr:cofactor-independent phosphoglycerate mutase [Tissierellia bacterium]
MKYIVFLGDGMADYKVPELGDKTPLEKANKPNIDRLASKGEVGLVQTVPDGVPPGSDTANLSVMGYDPKEYYTGRSPLEAVSMGLELKPDDMTFRVNLVTLSDEEPFENKIMLDYSSDEISTEEAAQLINAVNGHFRTEDLEFFPGISYRHCMVWHGAEKAMDGSFALVPPHDILERRIAEYLPKGGKSEILLNMMRKSADFLNEEPINRTRIEKGLNPANTLWIWGEGRVPQLSSFEEKYGIKGAVVSAVDLIKGIGICAGLKSYDVEGATGTIDTNFPGKAEAAIQALQSGADFVYLHMEAPDECGHRYEIDSKVKSIEMIDELVIGPVIDALEEMKSSTGEEYSVMVLPDHPTPLSLRTHTSDPVPYLIYRSDAEEHMVDGYDEIQAQNTGILITEGHRLMDRFLSDSES